MDEAEFERLARLPADAAWASAVLAGAVAGAASPASPSLPSWPEAPPEVRQLARALACEGAATQLSRPSGRAYDIECALVLEPELPCPQLRAANAFELVRCEDGVSFALAWSTRSGERVTEVFWVDMEDGASRREGTLEEFCRRIVFDSLFALDHEDQDPEEHPEALLERNPDALYLDEHGSERLRHLLQRLTARRAELHAAARREVADAELQIEQLEATGADTDAAYAQLERASDALELLGGDSPWPAVAR